MQTYVLYEVSPISPSLGTVNVVNVKLDFEKKMAHWMEKGVCR